MKKITNLIAATLCILMASLCACSSGNDDMYQFVSGDNAIILALSPEQIIKNAGFTAGPDGLKAPEGFERITGNNELINTLLKIKGIDASNVIFTTDIANNDLADAVMVARVTDKAEVTKFLESEQYTKGAEADGYDIYQINATALMLSDELLVMLEKTSAEEAAAKLSAIRDKAAQQSLKDWQKDVLNGNGTLRLITKTSKLQMADTGLNIAQLTSKLSEKLYGVNLSELYSVTTATLKGNALEGEGKVCDSNGKELKIVVDCPKIDTSLLKYCHAGDQMIFMTSTAGLVDWSELLTELLGSRSQATMIGNVLADIDGTVMISAGVSDINQVMSSAQGFQLTAAVQFKDAKKYAEQIEMLTRNQTTSYGDVKTVKMPGLPEISYTVKDKTIVMSVGAPLTDEGSKVFKGNDFSGKIYAFELRVPADSPNVTATPLPFSPHISATADTKTSQYSLKLEGSDTPLLEQLIKYASQI